MRGVKLDLTGRRFGKLRVIGESEGRRRGNICWRVQCDCGSPEKVVTGAALVRETKPTRACGCGWRKPSGESARHRALLNYKRNARTRSIVWGLSDERFATLTRTDCHYCGRPPANTCSDRESNGSYTYNGIDRRDNGLGYAEGNALPCCKVCNWAKGGMSYDDFMAWVGDLVRHQAQKTTSNPLVRGQSA
jgi:hypothetical protein